MDRRSVSTAAAVLVARNNPRFGVTLGLDELG
jgi:hypothetical protein